MLVTRTSSGNALLAAASATFPTPMTWGTLRISTKSRKHESQGPVKANRSSAGSLSGVRLRPLASMNAKGHQFHTK